MPVTARIPWTLDDSGPVRLPKTVYARFDGPRGIAVTRDGSTVYVADWHNNAIRKITGFDRAALTKPAPVGTTPVMSCV